MLGCRATMLRFQPLNLQPEALYGVRVAPYVGQSPPERGKMAVGIVPHALDIGLDLTGQHHPVGGITTVLQHFESRSQLARDERVIFLLAEGLTGPLQVVELSGLYRFLYPPLAEAVQPDYDFICFHAGSPLLQRQLFHVNYITN